MTSNDRQSDAGKRKVRVDFRRNRGRRARNKDWTGQIEQEGVGDESPQSERVTAKGDLSRKRTVVEGDESNWRRGRVVAMRGLVAEVDDGGIVWPCTVRRVLRTRRIDGRGAVTVGDWVRYSVVADRVGVEREGVIERVEERQGCLTRVSKRRVHTMAANVDRAIIVASASEPPPKPHLVDRYIVASLAGGIEPVICLSKSDLSGIDRVDDLLQRYSSLGYETLLTSSVCDVGIAALRDALSGRTSVLVGQSGVGKSSLLNALDQSLELRIGEVSDVSMKGKHTTTTARLIRLGEGTYVVDTPGVRALNVSMVPKSELEMYFVDFGPHIPDCKYPNCTHIHEDDCAVKKAVEAGAIHGERYESFVRMFTDAPGGNRAKGTIESDDHGPPEL
jgi:ribosome biogenesis GTPase